MMAKNNKREVNDSSHVENTDIVRLFTQICFRICYYIEVNLNQQQKSKLIQFYPELRTYFDLQELKDKRPETDAFFTTFINKLQTLKGDKGDKPVKGEDYLTAQEIQVWTKHLLEKATPQKGKHYFDGKNGDNYVLTDRDKKDIAKSISVPIVEKVTEKVERIVHEPIPVSADDMRNALHSLPEGKRIHAEFIDGLTKILDARDAKIKSLLNNGVKLKKQSMPENEPLDQRWHGGGSPSSSSSSGAFPPMTTVQRFALSPTNGQTAFDTTIGAPYIYVNGQWYALQLSV